MTPPLGVVEFNDPGCPFGYSAEQFRRRIAWLYGAGIATELKLVGLTEDPSEAVARGLTTEMVLANFKRLAESHGMPFTLNLRPRLPATIPACRAIVAARLHAAGKDRLLMRWIRIHGFGGSLIDEPATIDAAARDASIDPADLAAWVADPAVELALREDMAAARSPSKASQALDHKLGGPPEERRYTCPSWEITGANGKIDAPGFQPFAVYETAIANLAPELERRAKAETSEEVLEWAGEPLATREVAEIMELDDAAAAERLRASGAREIPLETSSFWSLA